MKKIIGVIGLGYVGLPLLYLLTKNNYIVYGFDSDLEKISKLKKSISYISDLKNKQIKSLNKKYLFTMENIKLIENCDYIIFCLPTPLRKKIPDMSFVDQAFNSCYEHLRENQTIILESTVYPGATEEIFVKKLLKKFVIGKNFFLCYSPERIDPGNSQYKSRKYAKITKLISGHTEKCEKKITELYKIIFKKIYLCETIKIAETSKLFENSFRSVNIGLSNEFKMLCNKLRINIFSVLNAAETKPFGFTRFDPGPGVGGHCIPIDPLFISWIGNKNNFNTGFINYSHKINKKITSWVINKIERIYNSKKKTKKTKILFIGITYKKNVNDTRESPSLKIVESFDKKNILLDYYDPYVSKIRVNNKFLISIKNLNNINKYLFTVLLVDHQSINLKKVYKNSKLIIDTRGKFFNINSDKKVVSL